MTPFPAVTRAQWEAAAAKSLEGGPGAARWRRFVDDGVTVPPLVTERPDGASTRRLDGARPGNMALAESDSPEALARDVADDARGGVDGWRLRARAGGAVDTAADTARVLASAGIGATIAWEAGADALPAAAVLEAARTAGSPPAAWHAIHCADPLASWAADGTLPRSLDALDRESVALFRGAARHGGRIVLEVSTRPYHRAGARPAQEIGFALAAGLARLRALLDGGIAPADAAAAIGFSVSIGRGLFPGIAKLRALRAAWTRVLAAHGVEAPPAWLHAYTSERTLTARDPWVNLLRVTGQAFAAITGGADAVTAAAYDRMLRTDDGPGRRIARNTLPILLDECAVGDVADAAGGAYLVESLTDAMARSAWASFRDLERDGGLAAALRSGRVHATLADAWRARAEAAASGSAPVTGVSVFADATEAPPDVIEEPGAATKRAAAAPAALPADAASDPARLFDALVDAARAGAGLAALSAALNAADPGAPETIEPLPRHRDAESFEAPAAHGAPS